MIPKEVPAVADFSQDKEGFLDEGGCGTYYTMQALKKDSRGLIEVPRNQELAFESFGMSITQLLDSEGRFIPGETRFAEFTTRIRSGSIHVQNRGGEL